MSKQNQNAGAGQAVPPAETNDTTVDPSGVVNSTDERDELRRSVERLTKERDDAILDCEIANDKRVVEENNKAFAENEQRRAEEKLALAGETIEDFKSKLIVLEHDNKKLDELRDFLVMNASMPPDTHQVDAAIELLKKQNDSKSDTEKLLHVARYFVSKARYNKQLLNWQEGVDSHLTMEQRISIVKPEEIDEALAYEFPQAK